MSTELRGAVVTIYVKKDIVQVIGTELNPPEDGYNHGSYTFISSRSRVVINGKFKIQKSEAGCIDLIPDGDIIIKSDKGPTEILVKEKKKPKIVVKENKNKPKITEKKEDEEGAVNGLGNFFG